MKLENRKGMKLESRKGKGMQRKTEPVCVQHKGRIKEKQLKYSRL
jgi:hypothetical protein